jgi:hypothetical protein
MSANEETRDDRMEHLCLLALSLAALAGSFWLEFSADGNLILTIPIYGMQMTLPDACWSHRIFGLPCPGCGLTRSFVAMAHDGVKSAFQFHPLGPVLFVMCCFQIPYRLLMFFRHDYLRQVSDSLEIITWVVILALLTLWGLRLVEYYGLFSRLSMNGPLF